MELLIEKLHEPSWYRLTVIVILYGTLSWSGDQLEALVFLYYATPLPNAINRMKIQTDFKFDDNLINSFMKGHYHI